MYSMIFDKFVINRKFLLILTLNREREDKKLLIKILKIEQTGRLVFDRIVEDSMP